MFGLETMLHMTLSSPMFSVCRVPESAAPLSAPTRTSLSISGGTLSCSPAQDYEDRHRRAIVATDVTALFGWVVRVCVDLEHCALPLYLRPPTCPSAPLISNALFIPEGLSASLIFGSRTFRTNSIASSLSSSVMMRRSQISMSSSRVSTSCGIPIVLSSSDQELFLKLSAWPGL